MGATGTAQRGNDAAADEERQMYSRDGKKEPGFADAAVPTLEEKTVMEHRPQETEHKHDKPIMDALEVPGAKNAEPREATTANGEKFGAPADASTSAFTDDQPPHARSGDKDFSAEEQGAVHARSLLRKHLSVSVGAKPWTVPTPAPNIDPHGFKDPVCDEFFKDVWVAAAVHNVSRPTVSMIRFDQHSERSRPKYSARSFTVLPMIWLPLGNNTRSFLNIRTGYRKW
jgi:phospholipase D1/2